MPTDHIAASTPGNHLDMVDVFGLLPDPCLPDQWK